MKRCFSIALMVLFLLGVVACSPATVIRQEPTPTVVSASDAYHPLGTQTGIQVIDRVLSAVATGDPQKLRAVIEFFDAKCTQREGLGGPPKCREAEAEGTPVEVLAVLGPEGGHLRKDEIENWPGIRADGVYAVYEVNTAVISSEQYYPVGNYAILFVDEENKIATALRIGERGIVRVDSFFDVSPESLDAVIEREASKVILLPKN